MRSVELDGHSVWKGYEKTQACARKAGPRSFTQSNQHDDGWISHSGCVERERQPTGVTVTFNPTSITGTGTSTMRMAVGASVTPARYTIIVTGTAGSTTHTTTVSLTVTGTTGSFTLAAKPKKVRVARGGRGAAKITATPSGGFNSTIALSASGQPAGVTAAFVPSSIVGGSGTASRWMVHHFGPTSVTTFARTRV